MEYLVAYLLPNRLMLEREPPLHEIHDERNASRQAERMESQEHGRRATIVDSHCTTRVVPSIESRAESGEGAEATACDRPWITGDRGITREVLELNALVFSTRDCVAGRRLPL